MSHWRALLIALQFLTRLPVRLACEPQPRDLGRSLLYYPVVGLILGLLLVALAGAMAGIPGRVGAALLLVFWVLATGALHLDGLADSADAWVGGLGDRDRTLAIMKDPCCGPAAVVAIVAVLLVKFSALESLALQGDWVALVLAPLLGRTALPALFLTTSCTRPGGLAAALAEHLPRRAAAAVVLAVIAGVAAVAGIHGLWLVAIACAMFAGLRALMVRRLGGTTGDTAGAMVEIIEVAVLAAATMV